MLRGGSITEKEEENISGEYSAESIEENQEITLVLRDSAPEELNVTLSDLEEQASYKSRIKDRGIINAATGASALVRESGQINLAAGKESQYKINPNGITTEISLESRTVTNRKSIKTDDLVINDHKLNPKIYEYSDFKEQKLPISHNKDGQEAVIGNFTVMGSVLVKAWEPNLKRYMMIRRPCRMPLFSTKLNLPDILPSLSIKDPLKTDERIMALSTAGYQVNAGITDLAAGIENTAYKETAGAAYADSIGMVSGNSRVAVMWNALHAIGMNDIASAGIAGVMSEESGIDENSMECDMYISGYSPQSVMNPEVMDEYTRRVFSCYEISLDKSAYRADGFYYCGIGICQWTGPRAKALIDFAKGRNTLWNNLGLQIEFMAGESRFNSIKAALNNADTPAQASRIFARDFEGNELESFFTARAEAATRIYSTMKGIYTV